MKKQNVLLATLLTSVVFAACPVMAATDASGNSMATASGTPSPAQQIQSPQSVILGNISIANIALAYGMDEDASSHIAAARQAIATLTSKTAYSQQNTSMTAGKLSYKTPNGQSDYWIPVENDHFVVRTIDGKHISSQNPDIDVSDAQIVHYKMALDANVADTQLAKAQNAIGQKQYDVAAAALQAITKGAVTEIVVEDRPLEAARDNLILSKELLQDKDYRGASFALKHANKDLAQVEKNNPNDANNADIKNMRSQIDSLQASIAQQNPSMLKTAEMKIDTWIKDVKSKIHS